MTSPKLTRCPKCHASSRMTQSHLKTTKGSVRCGSCFEVFNAFVKTPGKINNQPSKKTTRQAPHPNKPVENPAPRKNNTVSPENITQHININKELLTIEAAYNKRELATISWGLVAVLTMTMLIFQYFWFNREQLSIQKSFRPAYLWACEAINCDLPDITNRHALESTQLLVRSHPSLKDVLIVDSVIINQANFPQPWPDIELVFTDLNGQPVASRLFKPEHYLGGDLAGSQTMPSRQPIRLSIDIVDPGKDAISYEITFHSA